MEVIIGGKGAPPPPKKQPNLLVRLLAFLLTLALMLGAVALVSWRTTGRPGNWPATALAAICWLRALATLPLAAAGLMSNFGG